MYSVLCIPIPSDEVWVPVVGDASQDFSQDPRTKAKPVCVFRPGWVILCHLRNQGEFRVCASNFGLADVPTMLLASPAMRSVLTLDVVGEGILTLCGISGRPSASRSHGHVPSASDSCCFFWTSPPA